MEDTIRRLAKLLGAQGLESAGHDTRFFVDGADGSRFRVSIEGAQQRLMGVLTDAHGVARCDLDVAPIKKVSESADFPGRVTLHVGTMLVHIDSKPTLAVELVSDDEH